MQKVALSRHCEVRPPRAKVFGLRVDFAVFATTGTHRQSELVARRRKLAGLRRAFYAAAEKPQEAKAALAEAMKLNPKLSAAWLDTRLPGFIGAPPGFREALIKAGLPEE